MNEADTEIPLFTEKDKARFWAKVNKDGPTMPHMKTPCWAWTASKDSRGYGQIRLNRTLFNSHRASWMIHNGSIPHDGSYHGTCVCHHCDNPSCVNPSHLMLGSHTANMRDKERKGRGNQPKGNANGMRTRPERAARGESNGGSKLTESQVIEIRKTRESGISVRSIASLFKISPPQVYLICARKKWAHIP